jgi:hypothetical protein
MHVPDHSFLRVFSYRICLQQRVVQQTSEYLAVECEVFLAYLLRVSNIEVSCACERERALWCGLQLLCDFGSSNWDRASDSVVRV